MTYFFLIALAVVVVGFVLMDRSDTSTPRTGKDLDHIEHPPMSEPYFNQGYVR